MSRDISYGELNVGQQYDVVSTEADCVLDRVNKSATSRTVQLQERACYKGAERRAQHFASLVRPEKGAPVIQQPLT